MEFAYFDRFDIAEAYWVYYMLWHAGGLTERYHATGRGISAQLNALGFKPAPSISGPEDLTDNGRAIYERLVSKYEPVTA